VKDKSVLVIGCGEGLDAIHLAKLGANVYAFDISPDMLAIAKARARDEGVSVKFIEMAAENLDYRDNEFDVVVAVNILHHCNLDKCLPEIRRVAKPDAFVLVNELYTHRLLQRIRESRMGCALRRIVAPLIYPNNYAYVTEDERKLNEKDLSAVRTQLTNVRCRYFGLVVNRFLPAWDFAAKLDRVALGSLGPAGYLFAGRFILTGHVRK
jgi:ubiquinone/menaquinone biosynthesis C-methylase UbiE